jgi:hypothetical protein
VGYFLFATASRAALVPPKSPIQWIPGALSLGIKRPGCEADHSFRSSAEAKNAWCYTSTPAHVFITWCVIKLGYLIIVTRLRIGRPGFDSCHERGRDTSPRPDRLWGTPSILSNGYGGLFP